MSVWTQVSCEMIFPEAVATETLEKVFGKELDLKFVSSNDYYQKTENGWKFDDKAFEKDEAEANAHNKREWNSYVGHEDEYLPCGSEGTLHYVKCRRCVRKTSDGRYKYEIKGSLRDYGREDLIVRWFMDKLLGFSNEHDGWTFKVYAKISASSGVGELTWEYGKYD